VAMRVKGIKKSIEREFQKNDFSKSQKAAEIPDKVKRVCDITYHNSKTGRTIWELKKKNTVPKRYILFIHGGYFVHNITTYDWNLLNKIVQHTDYGIVVPDYPLAPRYNYKDVYNMAVPLYEDLLQEFGNDNLVIMGFSAGGGFTLSLAEYVKSLGLKQPSRIILLSPMLDASMKDPDISIIDKRDPYLDLAGMNKAYPAYANGTDIHNYMISPINGDVEGLAPIHLFMGTDEIYLPFARKLVAMAKAKNVDIDYHEYPAMYHAWIFLNMPEAKDFFSKLMDILH
jgi:acetyl esterase/lipase